MSHQRLLREIKSEQRPADGGLLSVKPLRHIKDVSCLVLLLLCWSSVLPECHAVQRESFGPLKLMDDLFQNYSTYVTPRLDPSQAVDLTCFVNYVSLLSLDNLAQEMTSQVLFNFGWTDELLAWNPQQYDNVSVIYPSAEMLWRPGFLLLNELSRSDSGSETTNLASVTFMGLVLWAQTLILKTQCSLDMSRFPFDEQVCRLHLYMNRPIGEMKLKDWSVSFSSDVQTNGEWEQIGTSGSLDPRDFGLVYDTLYIEISLKRLSRYYLVNVIAPMLLLSSLCNVVFLVSAESGDKLSVALTLLLSESVFLSYTSSLMPKTSDELPILTLYFLCLLVVNTVSILATLLVLKTFKYSAKSDCPEPPRVLQTIRDIFGPKLKPPVGVLEERNADNPHTLDVTKPNTPSMSTRRAGSFRALSQKLAQVSTLGWFRARDAESKGLKHKNPNKVAPEKSASERAPVSGTILVNPPDISESKFSGPIRVPFSECTLVDLSNEKVCNGLSRSCSENVHDKESCLEKGSFNPKEEANLCQSDGNIMYDIGITNNCNRGANWADVVASNLYSIGNKNKNSCPLA
ncbi:hypothetical protein RRG08_066344 [Elysia crispata]|uniref:Neurotransmitter-gated ion-channel ligand-binding domain-containing protein n=1 Tax=Elysia crispata TaxID=231223 RepID=A0AAE1CUU3_9GAST|nr:hypothetical protein RRG08_066344 [Elysia crispata]